MTTTSQPHLAFSSPPLPSAHRATDTTPTALGLLVGTKAALHTLAPAITGAVCVAVSTAPDHQHPEPIGRKQ